MTRADDDAQMSLPETFDVLAPRLRGRALLGQSWRDLAFLHWAIDPGQVAPLLPAGTRPDVFEGATYVGLIPFRMARAGFGRRGALPWVGDFLETNVRLYSVDDAGHHGVVFRSLDASRLLFVLGARAALRLPYVWSRMTVDQDDACWTWTSTRRWPRPALRVPAATRIRVRVGAPIEPTPLDSFLTARWGLHTRVRGRTVWLPNEHRPWPLHAAELIELDDSLVACAGLEVAGPPTAPVRWTPGVRTAFGRDLGR